MKYWNKRKDCRKQWTLVKMPFPLSKTFLNLKIWCQRYESKGRFYAGPYTQDWYFEFPEDAIVFKLIHGYK